MNKSMSYKAVIHCLYILIIFSLAFSPISYAQNSCQSIVESSSLEEASRRIHPASVRDSAHNVFTDSILATIVTSALWLTGVQLMREPNSQALLDTSFQRVLVIDVALTITSHAIALAQLPWAKTVFEKISNLTKPSKSREFWARAGANTLMGTTVITVGWALTGINLSWLEVAGAFGLSAVVYPTLQATKEFLFKAAPSFNQQRFAASLEDLFPKTSKHLADQSLSFNFESDHFNVDLLNAMVTSIPYEERLDKVLPFSRLEAPGLRLKLKRLRTDIHEIKSKLRNTEDAVEQAKYAHNLQQLRRQWIDIVLKSSLNVIDQEKLLDLGEPFKKPSASHSFQVLVNKEVQNKKWRILGMSVIDQAISVGIAGGVLLYSTTHWAATGQLPW